VLAKTTFWPKITKNQYGHNKNFFYLVSKMYVLEWSKNTTRDSGDIENISELPELAEL
jgi:hypothetical protein